MDKHIVAEILQEISTLLALNGENSFKVRAYHIAAHAIESLREDLQNLILEKRLKEIPGIGEQIAEKITILAETGRLPYYEKLKTLTPPGLLELLYIPGLGAKRIRALYERLKVRSVEDLFIACKQGKVAVLKGFGEKIEALLLQEVIKRKTTGKRWLWTEAEEIAHPLLHKIIRIRYVERAAIVGSLRRGLETVADIDYVVASARPRAVVESFASFPELAKVLTKEPKKISVELHGGLHVDLYLVLPDEYGFALIHYTGSREHNMELDKRALTRGYALSARGFIPVEGKLKRFSLKNKVWNERSIYRSLGLSYIPPEVRENRGECTVAARRKLPQFVEIEDIRGVFHCHTTESDGQSTLEEMAEAAQMHGWEYIGISDHSVSSVLARGLDADRLLNQIEHIRALNASGVYSIYLFSGLECDIDRKGKLDFPDEILQQLDFVIVSIHRSMHLDEAAMTQRLIKAIENPHTTMVGHLTGRLLLHRDPYRIDVEKVIDACIANHTIVELNSQPTRLDMEWRYWQKAAQKGLKCSINPDAHSVEDFANLACGIRSARKGWLESKHIFNTLALERIKKFFIKKR